MSLSITKSTSRLNPLDGTYSWRNVNNDSGFAYEEFTISAFSELPGIYGAQLTDHAKPLSVVVFEKVVSGLVISSITRPSGSTSRYYFSGGPDLSSLAIGQKLFAAQCASLANNLRGVAITAFDNTAKWIEVSNAGGSAQASPGGECAVGKSSGFSSTTSIPGPGQFWADAVIRTGKIIFHSSDSAKTVIVDYDGGGSVGTISALTDIAKTTLGTVIGLLGL